MVFWASLMKRCTTNKLARWVLLL
jgi:hypothetical protein